MDIDIASIATQHPLMTAALTLTLAWYIAYWYVNKRGVVVGAGAAVAKADKDEAIRDELEEVATTPVVGLAGTLSEPRMDRNARAALLRDAKQAAPGAPVPMHLQGKPSSAHRRSL